MIPKRCSTRSGRARAVCREPPGRALGVARGPRRPRGRPRRPKAGVSRGACSRRRAPQGRSRAAHHSPDDEPELGRGSAWWRPPSRSPSASSGRRTSRTRCLDRGRSARPPSSAREVPPAGGRRSRARSRRSAPPSTRLARGCSSRGGVRVAQRGDARGLQGPTTGVARRPGAWLGSRPLPRGVGSGHERAHSTAAMALECSPGVGVPDVDLGIDHSSPGGWEGIKSRRE